MPNSTFSFLASESSQTTQTSQLPPWKVLIVDDEPEIHDVTIMALSKFTYDGRELSFLHAYSKADAIKHIQSEPEVCVVLLDVIMETDNAGLECVRQIRQELSNHDVRIILRTGQPSTIPEHEVMLKYDINDYKNKVDLTKSRLYITMTSALRAFRDIKKQSKLASELKELNETLEAKVEQRTAELVASNHSLREAKDKIIRQQATLLQSEKMASVGYLAAGMAHEINNPLGALKCNFAVLKDYIDTLQEKVGGLREHQLESDFNDIGELLEDNAIDLNRIERIVAALSIFNGVSDEQPRGHDLQEMLTTFCSDKAEHGIYESSHAQSAQITCCREQLLRAFEVLYINAKESGSDINEIKVTTNKSAGFVHIVFEDKGCGIEENKLPRIFDPFFTTKPVGSNVGLGLTIALMMVKNQGGEIIAASTLNIGSRFEIQLPHTELA
ncbi:ATP-binding protein [Pseudoalteromonas luteoviolacea]|uniref:histidine kinase n=1 Tax=Pseudoalteromonas luteoviolacea S4054 TaxID=1129367 RepID=A0A0F6A7Q4_9GAMM|nr:ATP-binding protein [Pseudoalteromonas luteoviolacea]AOT10478.1 hypothetical protein S4054249_21660 [Pseudoalteromonas luteoviolacea]AOT15453.1 hypothetical protein S40542_21935 [Pseudoalteromonas luteoviolacea]AOT20297.1 hypothetical protein S4054_21575 [Pseudoalteromonas luteoviolacea]KKE81424.1 hypothetical protein N479_02785 [Pseudoalteromonas luteoviolacea S4054]KZN71679.1 hypothetical protein N481_18595 [Pseudoalteromonas luteoviolacea S4047-1]